MAKDKDVIVFEEQFPMIAADNSSVLEAMRNNLENEEISRREMFTPIPNPAGGSEEWTIETPMGGRNAYDTLEGIILAVGNDRAFYENPYGVGDKGPPLCSSADGVIGIGEPGGRCVECEMSKFGPNSEPPRCGHKKPMYMLIPDVNPVMPVVLNVTGPSFPTLKTFLVGLMRYGVNTFDVKVRLSLKKEKTKNNMPASVIQFKTIGNIRQTDPESYKKIVAYRNSIMEFLDPKYDQIKEITEDSAAA